MKKLLNSFLSIIGRAKLADFDNDGKVESLNEEIKGLFLQFKTMSEKIEETNNKLVEVMEDEERKQISELRRLEEIKLEVERKVEESKELQSKVEANINSNNKIKSKVDEFVVD